MLNIKDSISKPNPDLVKERQNGNVDIVKLKSFFGLLSFGSAEKHKEMLHLSKQY